MKGLLVLLALYLLSSGECSDDSDTVQEKYYEMMRRALAAANVSEGTETDYSVASNLGIDYDCDTTTHVPPEPTSVQTLSPHHVGVVAAMGDSVTAAMGAGARLLPTLTEYRGLSWSIGGDNDLSSVVTLPNLIRKFNPDVKGFSIKTGGKDSSNARLNVAVSGAVAANMYEQAEKLVRKMNEMGVTDEDWKVITIWIGGNDLCAICSGDPEEHANKYKERLKAALDYLSDNVKRAYVNLALIIDVTELAQVNGLVCGIVHWFACDCATKEASKGIVRESSIKYNEKLQDLIDESHYTTDTFTVELQPFFSKTLVPLKDGKPDKSYFAPDCFHFSQKGHGVGATYLWNNMFEDNGEKTDQIDWDNQAVPKCPAENEYFRARSSSSAQLSVNADEGSSKEHSDSLLTILVATGVGIFLVAIIVMAVVVGVVRWRQKRRYIDTETVHLISVRQ